MADFGHDVEPVTIGFGICLLLLPVGFDDAADFWKRQNVGRTGCRFCDQRKPGGAERGPEFA